SAPNLRPPAGRYCFASVLRRSGRHGPVRAQQAALGTPVLDRRLPGPPPEGALEGRDFGKAEEKDDLRDAQIAPQKVPEREAPSQIVEQRGKRRPFALQPARERALVH